MRIPGAEVIAFRKSETGQQQLALDAPERRQPGDTVYRRRVLALLASQRVPGWWRRWFG